MSIKLFSDKLKYELTSEDEGPFKEFVAIMISSSDKYATLPSQGELSGIIDDYDKLKEEPKVTTFKYTPYGGSETETFYKIPTFKASSVNFREAQKLDHNSPLALLYFLNQDDDLKVVIATEIALTQFKAKNFKNHKEVAERYEAVWPELIAMIKADVGGRKYETLRKYCLQRDAIEIHSFLKDINLINGDLVQLVEELNIILNLIYFRSLAKEAVPTEAVSKVKTAFAVDISQNLIEANDKIVNAVKGALNSPNTKKVAIKMVHEELSKQIKTRSSFTATSSTMTTDSIDFLKTSSVKWISVDNASSGADKMLKFLLGGQKNYNRYVPTVFKKTDNGRLIFLILLIVIVTAGLIILVWLAGVLIALPVAYLSKKNGRINPKANIFRLSLYSWVYLFTALQPR